MLNYKECSIEDFNAAMQQKDADVQSISDSHLYILYTKFQSDASRCFYADTGYAVGLGRSSDNKAKTYKAELQRRGIMVR